MDGEENKLNGAQQWQQPPNMYYYPPPPRNNKYVIIATVVIVAVLITAVIGFLLFNPFGSKSYSSASKSMADIIKSYDKNGNGRLDGYEEEDMELNGYKPGDTVHIVDTVYDVGPSHTFNAQEINDFYQEYSVYPSLDIKPGDEYTFLELKSPIDYAKETGYENWSFFSLIAIKGNVTSEYSPGDTISFYAKIVKVNLTYGGFGGEFVDAWVIAYMIPVMGTGGGNLAASLTYIVEDSNATSAQILVRMSAPAEVSFSEARLTIIDTSYDTASISLSTDWQYISLGGLTYRVKVIDIDASATLTSGDRIVIDGGSNPVGGLEVNLSVSGYSGVVTLKIPS